MVFSRWLTSHSNQNEKQPTTRDDRSLIRSQSFAKHAGNPFKEH